MLLEFRAKNYKSFQDELIFSMQPAPKQKGLDYSIIEEKIKRKTYRALCSSIIYGPNAAGKTNIIGAMEALKAIMLRGNILNCDEFNNPNVATNLLELIPNNLNKKNEPVCFHIEFTASGYYVNYDLVLDLGKFLVRNFPRRVLRETLEINGEFVFERTNVIKFGSCKSFKKLLPRNFEEMLEPVSVLAQSNLQPADLFLMNGFKNLFSPQLVGIICEWLNKQFMVIYRADALRLIRRLSLPQKNSAYVETTLNDAATSFGINSNGLGYVAENDGGEAKLCSLFKQEVGNAAIPAEVFESYGTMRFVNLFPLVANALATGGTLVVDEFDASIHPMALMNIINIFHNDELNVHGAQLIFNTHNPIFLNANLYRRDEIKFVERDDETHCSSCYTLADFGTSGKNGVRRQEDYLKNYFVDRYGAIKNIDFAPVLQNMMVHEE